MKDEDTITKIEQALKFEFSCMVYVTENEDHISDESWNTLKTTAIRYKGKHQLFLVTHYIMQKLLSQNFGGLSLENTGDMLYVLRSDNPVFLENFVDLADVHQLWAYYDDYKHRVFAQFRDLPMDDMFHLVLFDTDCSASEIRNVKLWNDHKDADQFANAVYIKQTETLNDFKSRWKITGNCTAVFVKKVNSMTFDKFKVESEFIGKFTLDEFSKKLTMGKIKRWIASQNFSEVKGEEDYRLIAGNLDDTLQQMKGNKFVLFYKSTQTNYDHELLQIYKGLNGKCENNDDVCQNEVDLIKEIQESGSKIFSVNISLNDLPSFVLDHSPSLILFEEGSEDPLETKLKTVSEIRTTLRNFFKKKNNQKREESEL